MREKIGSKIFVTGAALILIGAILPFFKLSFNDIIIAPFVFSLGVVCFLTGRYMQPMSGDDFRMKRLRVQQFAGACLLIAASYLMFVGDKNWVICLFISAVIELVVTFRMPKE